MQLPLRIALFVDQPDWHSRRLAKAFAAHGAGATCISLRDCGFRIGDSHGLTLGQFADLPDGAFVRQIAAGSFEQVTMRLGVLHGLRDAGVAVYNDARVVERCVDKSMTSYLLQRAGVPTPQTWVTESEALARNIVRAEASRDEPLVLKPLFGSQGRGLRLIEDEAALPATAEVCGVYYLQRFMAGPGVGWRDWRVFVVGGRAVAAMLRHGVQWRTNAAQGARCEGVAATGDIAELAVAASQAVGACYAGVDVIRDAAGRAFILEVNSMPAWEALQQVSKVDIADALAGDFVQHLRLVKTQRPPIALNL